MRFRKSKMGALALAITVSAVAGAVPARADEAAAARQFRIARRLAAERSPQAAAALRKVVELAPEGPLADDALVEEANLLQIPDWPSDLGVLEEDVLKQALEILARVTAGYPGRGQGFPRPSTDWPCFGPNRWRGRTWQPPGPTCFPWLTIPLRGDGPQGPGSPPRRSTCEAGIGSGR